MNEEYSKLIERVRKIDESAAAYMFTEARKLRRFHPKGDLRASFIWLDTPQGWNYWHDIAVHLGEYE